MRTAKLFVLFTRFVLSLGMLCELGWSALAFAQVDAGVTLAAAAQTSADVEPAVGGIYVDSILGIVLKVLAIIFTAILFPKLIALAVAHENDKNASSASRVLWTAVEKAAHFSQLAAAAIVPGVQADLDAGKPIGDVAGDVAKSTEKYLGTEGISELGDVLGMGVDLVKGYLQDLATKHVAEAQAAGAAAAAGVTDGQKAVLAINMKGA